MAFQKTKFNDFFNLVKTLANGSHGDTKAIAQNFILEERLSESREDSYQESVGFVSSRNKWTENHDNIYVRDKIYVRPGIPETFTDSNEANFGSYNNAQYLLRMERMSWPNNIYGENIKKENIKKTYKKLKDFLKAPEKDETRGFVNDFFDEWNSERDYRPIFVGFWGEVSDLFTDAEGNEIYNDDWANRLRDRFGLGHLNPSGRESTYVLLLRYRLQEVAEKNPEAAAAIPTVLDSNWSPFFCPTPKKGFDKGQTVDLTAGDETNYSLNCEILHQHIDYKPEHLYRVGKINEALGKSLEKARKIHLELLKDDFQYFGDLP